jgi:hypothetical protein
MICTGEAVDEIAAIVGTKTVAPIQPQTQAGVYSCDYAYAHGATMALSVKELASTAQTTAYFDGLARTLGRQRAVEDIGEGAFATTNGSLVVRKDRKVLLVDVSHLPLEFEGLTRDKIAVNVAATIMACWTGA